MDNNKDNNIVGSGSIYQKNMEDVMHDAMMPYSEYVILDRALPRVEDGLKPVQRRILYSMHELGIRPDTPYRKCARVVGDCLGKYHPHGDSSVYGALARMAQPFNMRERLVDGQGNFGSIDGDGPAAMRYTECRMAPLALELLRDLDKDTVVWRCNFDDTLKEPDILPGRFPNLLVNGASGIAVGLATNIPPHNLAETIDGVCAYINDPKISLQDMMKIIKGPDFPGGCVVIGGQELRDAYETGRGKITMRARMHIEPSDGDKKLIVIDELPYQVNKAALLQSIIQLKDEVKESKDKKDSVKKYECLQDILDITDETDRTGMRAVIKLRKDADVKKIIEVLVKSTNISTSYGINMVAIADGKPQQMGLLDIIAYYADYQKLVILRRSKFLLEENKKKEHILLGLIIAVRNIDEVVRIIKTSNSTANARDRLKERFNISDIQAQAILDLRLARLTHIEVYKLEQELLEIQKMIKELTEIIGSKKLQWEVVKNELQGIKRQYKTARRTEIVNDDNHWIVDDQTIAKKADDCVVCVTATGKLKRMPVRNFTMANKECSDTVSKKEISSVIIKTATDERIYGFTNKGNLVKVDVKAIPEAKWRDEGTPLNVINEAAEEGEKILYGVAVKDKLTLTGNLMFYTRMGMVKKTDFAEYEVNKVITEACKINPGDEIIGIEPEKANATLVFVTAQGQCLNCTMEDIPLQHRASCGVKGMLLESGDYCVMARQISKKGEIVVVTDKAYAKRVLVSDFDVMGKYRKGVKIIDFNKAKPANGTKLVFACYITEPVKIAVESNEGELLPVLFVRVKKENRTHPGNPTVKGSVTVVKGYRYCDDYNAGV